MQKQKNNIFNLIRSIFIMLTLVLIGTPQTQAQVLNNNGELQRLQYTGGFEDLQIPASLDYDYLYLRLEGADGGNRKPSKKKNFSGGEGATVRLYLKLGTGTNEIRPGTTLRLIVGGHGETNKSGFVKGAKGGGGTGVLMKKPGQNDWVILAVAGGGGGASSTCCNGQTGVPGETGTSGSRGKGKQGGSGGSSGKDGKDGKNDATGGDGYLSALPKGSDQGSSYPGTFGFGAGGHADSGGGGGGGGYSGGGGGGSSHAGGGGGSYVTDIAKWSFKAKNGRTENPDHGFVELQFTNKTPNTIRLVGDSNKCIDVDNGNTGNGTNIKILKCNDNNSQRWMFDGTYFVSALDGNKCLDLKANNQTNGTNLQLWTCNENKTQRWVYDGVSKQIRYSANWNKCLDQKDGNIRIWDCKDGSNQQWYIDGADWNANGEASGAKTVYPYPTVKHNKCLGIRGKYAQSNNCSGKKDQEWLFDGVNIKYAAKQNKCLRLENGNTSNYTHIQLWDCDRNDKAQRWVYDGITGTIRYWENKKKCMAITGTSVSIMDCDGSPMQQWGIKDANSN